MTELLLDEIPSEVRKKENGCLNKTKILILCQDNKSCSQLNQFLTMGENRYLFYTAFMREITITNMASKYKNLNKPIPNKQESKKDIEIPDVNDLEKNEQNEEDANIEEINRSNYLITLTQLDNTSVNNKLSDENMFESLSQVGLIIGLESRLINQSNCQRRKLMH